MSDIFEQAFKDVLEETQCLLELSETDARLIFNAGTKAAVEHCKQGEPFAWSYSQRHGDGHISSHLSSTEPNKKLVEYGNIFEVDPLFLHSIQPDVAPQPPTDNDHVADGCELFPQAMPKSEGKSVECKHCETGVWQGNLCTECAGTGFTTPQPSTDVSELVKVLHKISELCPIDSEVNQLDEHPLNTVRLTLAEVGDTARSGLDIIAKKHCTRSHPHEDMDEICNILTEHAISINRQAHREMI